MHGSEELRSSSVDTYGSAGMADSGQRKDTNGCLGSSGSVECEPADALEMALVAGEEDEVVVNGRGADEEVEVGNQETLLPERAANLSENGHDCVGEREECEGGEKLPILVQQSRWFGKAKGALEELAVRDDADPDTLARQLLQRIHNARSADRSIDEDLGIDQILHGRVSGRVPSSRPRATSAFMRSPSSGVIMPAKRRKPARTRSGS